MAFDATTQAGDFSFSSLAAGTYYLYAEMAGTKSELVKVVLTDVNPEADVNMVFAGNRFTGMDEAHPGIISCAVYPVPVNDDIHLSVISAKQLGAGVSIYNVTGTLVAQYPISLNTGQNLLIFPADALPNGIFTLCIAFDNAKPVTLKLTVLR